jgi:hypothetical protein
MGRLIREGPTALASDAEFGGDRSHCCGPSRVDWYTAHGARGITMKIIAIPLALLLHVAAANAQNSLAEVVRFENVQEVKAVYVGNANKHYVLFCSVKTDGCITPEEDKDYLLFNKDSRWMMPGATKFLTLADMQDFTVTYNQGENIGLIAKDGSSGIGMFVLDKSGGGYEKDTINSDGPIIYGTNLSDRDRKKAWDILYS